MTTDVKGKTLTTRAKRKTNAPGAKGKTKATDLKEFLSNLATDPGKLGGFLHAPEDTMFAANLSEADKAALRSGVSGMVAARLAGVPLDQAFKPPLPFLYWMVGAPQAAWMQGAPQPPFLHWMVGAPQVASMQAAPQYVAYPPQFVVQPPPYYPR